MLKIKSNTNKFAIIFSEKIGKKKNAQKILFSLCSVQHPFFFSPSFLLVSVSFLFFAFVFNAPLCFFSAPPFVSFLPAFLFFLVHVCPFFNPKTFFLAQNVFASAQNLFFFQRLLLFFSLALFIQDPIFSLAASHLFYLNKSLFSSNLE